LNKLEYAAFEATAVAGNKILVCMPQTFESRYDRTSYIDVMNEIVSFIPKNMLIESMANTRNIKLNNGSSIRISTCPGEARGLTVSELIFTHSKEDYDPSYIYTVLLCIEDKKHRRIIGI
jgi:hypothetical protein